MNLKAIREALDELEGALDHPNATSAIRQTLERARAEAAEAEKTLRKSASLTVYAVAGLSAFHGRLCGMSRGMYPANAADCNDSTCRAWAAAVKGEAGPEDVRNAALEEAARRCERAGRPCGCGEELATMLRSVKEGTT